MKVKIVLPTRETPGYLRRQKRALEYRARLKNKDNDDPTLVDEMAAFIAPLVVVGEEDPQKAIEMVLDFSEAQFDDVLAALTGGGEDSALPPESSTGSSPTTS